MGSGASADKCLDRAEWWMKYCDTPVLATFVPEGVSSTWSNDWIMHDSHGGRMFEEMEGALNQINPDSMNPHNANPSGYNSEFKSMAAKSPDYHDSPEYRKSLHLQGQEKEEVLKNLRSKLGMQAPPGGMSSSVKKHQGVDTMKMNSQDMGSEAQYGYSTEVPKYEEPKQEYQEPKYEEAKQQYEEPKYEEPKSEAPKYAEASSETPKYEAPKYEEETVEPKYEAEEEKYEEEPKYEESDADEEGYGEGGQNESQEEPDSYKNTLLNN